MGKGLQVGKSWNLLCFAPRTQLYLSEKVSLAHKQLGPEQISLFNSYR